MYNIGIIAGALLFSRTLGIYSLAWGTVLGAALHLVVQLPGLLKLRPQYRPLVDFRDQGVWEVARLMGPRVLGLAIVQINFWVELVLASGMVDGSISALKRGFFVMLLPQGVIAQSVAIAVFPTFSAQVARGEHSALRRTLGQVLRAVLFLSLPATVGLIVLRLPIVRLIYEHGVFTPEESQATAWALLFYGLGLVFQSLLEIVTRAYYAMHDTKTPVIVGGGAMILNIVFSLLLMRVIGVQGSLTMGPFAGLALANTLATTLETLTLLVLLRPRVGGLEGHSLLASLSRASAASAVMGLVLWALLPLAEQMGPIVGTLGVMAIGGSLFWGVAWALGSEEARLFTGLILQRIRRQPSIEGTG
jgi:putative peptidoglycan lipid II flippase